MAHITFLLALLFAAPARLSAAAPPSPPPSSPPAPAAIEEVIEVTATRIPESVLDVASAITVVSGREIEARGARDLAAALSLVPGVSIAPGGDGGPASSVPELMGLREFDAFLLVVDGVPWGGAFNPALATLDLTNVDRIEVLRGAAPVLYGATSFVGVIHVIHRVDDATPSAARGWVGNHDSGGAAVTVPFGSRAGADGDDRFRSSLSASFDRQGLADDRAGFDRAHALWKGSGKVGAGELRLALDLTGVRQDPNSPHPRQGRTLSPLVPLDANHNPSDARLDEDRAHFVVGFDRAFDETTWSTTLALTHDQRDTTRGFLREDFVVPIGEPNASGYRQEFEGDDYYFDSHLALSTAEAFSVVAGLDVVAGRGEAESEIFDYAIRLDGSNPASSHAAAIVERPELEDERMFAGAYAQTTWTPAPRWRIEAGLRLNYTDETQEGEVEGENGDEVARDSRSDTRLSGSAGVSFLAWERDDQAIRIWSAYKDSFKPAAIDFGPEAEGEILDPETAQSVEVGVKGSHGSGRVTWQASVFRMDFENLVIARTVNGRPSLQNAGKQRFDGVEIEERWRATDALSIEASWAWHDATNRYFVQEFDGVPTQLAGKRLEMSPDQLGALGVTWAPGRGWFGYAVGNYAGDRFLNKRNTAPADPYTTVAVGGGYRFERFELRVDGDNLTDERPPVSESEIGEGAYYRLPARAYRFGLGVRF